MQLYGPLISPFVRKVALACAEKGVDYELVLVSPHAERPDFREASPFGKIPAIRDGDFLLADSSAIAHYLEAKHPSPALLPADPQARGRAVWLDEFADTLLATSALKILFNRLVAPKLLKLPYDEAIALEGEAELPPLFAWLEGQVPDDGAWMAGDAFGLGDIAVASVLRTLDYVASAPDPVAYPRIAAWYARVVARPAWQQVAAIEDAPRRKRD